jgi:D-alanyl-D-alanine carboxypeptidase
MIDHSILNTIKTSGKNRFPILAQLSILGFVLLLIFGSIFVLPDNDKNILVSEAENRYPELGATLVPQKIEEDLSLKAKAVYVWDVRSQRALYTKNPDESLPIASITKLMTALLAHELVNEDESAVVPKSAVTEGRSNGLSLGESFNIQALQKLALVASYNDAAYTLGASVGALLGEGDPTNLFVQGMNIRADELGLESLEFKNTTGLDISAVEPGATGSARDVTFLMEFLINNYPDIISVTKLPASRTYNQTGEYHDVENTNDVVSKIPNLIASKTGYTDLAGGNLTIAFDLGYNHPIIITVLGSTRTERFTDVLSLIEAVRATVRE